MTVLLEPVTMTSYEVVANLSVRSEQQPFVRSNALVLAELAFDARLVALAVQVEQDTVGMLAYRFDETTGRWWLHHFMIAGAFQRRGYGTHALERLTERLASTMHVPHLAGSYAVGNEAARWFCAARGFQQQAPHDGVVSVSKDVPLPPNTPATITLRPVTLQNARAITRLAVAAGQRRFVATNAESLIQWAFEPFWLPRAIYSGEVPVGFVMYGHDPEYGWGILRLMVDAAHQHRGYGRIAMQQVLEHIRSEGGTQVGVSYERDNTIARDFYQRLGFVETGEEPFGEPFAVVQLA